MRFTTSVWECSLKICDTNMVTISSYEAMSLFVTTHILFEYRTKIIQESWRNIHGIKTKRSLAKVTCRIPYLFLGNMREVHSMHLHLFSPLFNQAVENRGDCHRSYYWPPADKHRILVKKLFPDATQTMLMPMVRPTLHRRGFGLGLQTRNGRGGSGAIAWTTSILVTTTTTCHQHQLRRQRVIPWMVSHLTALHLGLLPGLQHTTTIYLPYLSKWPEGGVLTDNALSWDSKM